MRTMKSAAPALLCAALAAVSCGRNGGNGGILISGAAPAAYGLDAIAAAAEKTVDGVVNISTTRVGRSADPFFDNPLFRDFPGGGRSRETAQQSLGSGVIAAADGVILTNSHVVEGATALTVTLRDGRSFRAEIAGSDPETDLAVIRMVTPPSGLTPLPFGSSGSLRLGEVVLAIGNPFGLGHTVTMGIVSAAGRNRMGIAAYEDFIQTDAAINPGNSGGALVNLRGELVGICTAIASSTGGSQGVGFAIPSDMARNIIPRLARGETVSHGWLGIGIRDVTPDLAETMGLAAGRGVLVEDVHRDSPGSRAGLLPGDVILAAGDTVTNSAAVLRNTIAALGAGETVTLRVLRGTREIRIVARAGTRAGDSRRAARENALDGITVAPLDVSTRREYGIGAEIFSGVVVTGVGRNSPAERAGIVRGDVILEVNREPVPSVEAFARLYAAARGKTLFSVARSGRRSFVVVEK